MYMCVNERERGREKEIDRERERVKEKESVWERKRVCERERECVREKERKWGSIYNMCEGGRKREGDILVRETPVSVYLKSPPSFPTPPLILLVAPWKMILNCLKDIVYFFKGERKRERTVT